MKKSFLIASLMIVGLFLEVSMSYAYSRLNEEQAQNILNRVNREKSAASDWEPTGPTAEDIRSATKVEKLAAKGSLEDKLINAVKKGDLQEVESCIAKKVGLEARDNNDMTALMSAAQKGCSDIVRVLIDAGADINAQGKYRETAFFYAADKKHVDVVKILLAKGISIDSTVKDSFVSFVFQGNVNMVKAFIESGRMTDDILGTAQMHARSRSELYNIIAQARNK